MMNDEMDNPEIENATPQDAPASKDAADAQETGADSDMNQVCLGDTALQGAKAGDPVEFSATGIVTEVNGKRYVTIDAIDGEPVATDDDDESQDPNAAIEAAKNSLKSSISQQGGYNNAIE